MSILKFSSPGPKVTQVRESSGADPVHKQHHEHRLEKRAVCRLPYLLLTQTVQYQGQGQQTDPATLLGRNHREESPTSPHILRKNILQI